MYTTMRTKEIDHIFFIGIGGIGMSALARFYLMKGISVWGYDKTRSPLTETLETEGATIYYSEDWESHLNSWEVGNSLIVYTPAIPDSNLFLTTFKALNFRLLKRSELLGEITRFSKSLCIAGTHGKSTTSAMLAFLLSNTKLGCNAFLGAISSNFGTNFRLDHDSDYAVLEADEYDRSFLQLSPYISLITSMDPDHLDIYGTSDKFQEGFRQFARKTDPQGLLVLKEGLDLGALSRTVTYALDSSTADYSATNIVETHSGAKFSLRAKGHLYHDVCIGIHGLHNVENAVGALAICSELGLNLREIALSFSQFKGIKRRFEKILVSDKLVFVDDYAHHPTEIRSLLKSLRNMYPGQKITGIFQPHLFSRTRDFGDDFAKELSELDQLYLLPIYPAREEPIRGIDSDWLLAKTRLPHKAVIKPTELLNELRSFEEGVLVTIGAGDIDRLVGPISELLTINLKPL